MIAAAVIALAAPLSSIPPAAPPVQVPARLFLEARQLFLLAEQAAEAGDRAAAEEAFRALADDPDRDVRNHARFALARMLASNGRKAPAATLLRQILDEDPGLAAVRVSLAQLLASIGDEQSALRELRAAQAGSVPPEVARLVDRFSVALRARQPVGGSIEIAIAPDSNINRATRSDTVGTVIGPFAIDEGGKARSGTGLALKGQAFRRVGVSSSIDLLARLSTAADFYRRSDYNDIVLDVAAGPDMQLGRNRFRMELGANRRWIGQQPLLDSARIAASASRQLDRRTQVSVDASATLLENKFNDRQGGKAFAGHIAIERALTETTGIALTLTGERQLLKDAAYSTKSWRGGVVGWREVGRMTLSAGVDYGRLEADERLILLPEKRSEQWLRLSLGATMRQLTFGGFAPVARLVYERNRSSIEYYDYRRLRAEWGISRAF